MNIRVHAWTALVASFLLVLPGCWADTVEFLVSEDFEGVAVLVDGVEGYPPLEERDSRLVVRFDKEWLAVTSTDLDGAETHFYAEQEDGSLGPLEYEPDPSTPMDRRVAFRLIGGSRRGTSFMSFMIGTPTTSDRQHWQQQSRVSEALDTVMGQ